jgi:hypothetical protein
MLTSTGPPTPPVAPAFPAAEPPARVRVPGYNIELDLTMVRSKFNMRIDDAATDIGIPLSALKIACRQLGIARWPRRVKPRRNVPVAGPQSAQARDLAPAAGRQDNPLSSASSGEDSPRGVPMQAASTEGGIAISSDRSIVSRWSRVNAQTGGLLDWALDELGDCKVETRRGGSLRGSAIPRVTEGRATQEIASSDLPLLLASARRYPMGASGTAARESARKGGSGDCGGTAAAMQHGTYGQHDEGETSRLHRSGESPQTGSGSASFRLPHRQLSQALAVFTTVEFASAMASSFHY